MKKNTHGGGSKTNLNGLKFEQDTDLRTALCSIDGYSTLGSDIFFSTNKIGNCLGKMHFIKSF